MDPAAVVVVRAGPGAPWNRPGAERRDLGEEVSSPLPAAPWHGALRTALAALPPATRGVVVDVSELAWLPVEDWAVLAAVARELAARSVRCALVAGPRVVSGGRALGLDVRLPAFPSVADARAHLGA